MAVQSPKDILIFTGVMDGDTQARFIKDGNYIKLLNGRTNITNSGVNGSVEDTEGNIVVLNPFLALGTNKVVGSFEDVKDKTVIYFVYNSLGYHAIFRWYQESPGNPLGEIQKIWQVENPAIYNEFNKNPLNFDPDYLITGVALVDNLLNWNCYNDEPKQMDIVKANDTRKKRIFDLYINANSLGQSIDFSIEFFDPSGNIVSVLNFSDNSVSLIDRVSAISNIINQTPNLGYYAVDKKNYIELHCLVSGLYDFSYYDTAADQGRVLPNNFYYNDVPGNFFYRIQMPPTCSPEAYYIPTSSTITPNVYDAEYVGFVFSQSGISLTSNNIVYSFMGIQNDVNDTNNAVIIGTQSYSIDYIDEYNDPVAPMAVYQSNTGFFKSPSGLSQFQTIAYRLTLNVSSSSNDTSFPVGGEYGGKGYVEGYIKFYNSANQEISKQKIFRWINKPPPASGTTWPPPPYTQNITGTKDIYYVNGAVKGYIAFESFRTNYQISNAVVRFGAANLISSDEKIDKQTSCFRAKYIYENFQNSVYGQSTSVVLRTEAYEEQKQIYIDFTDKIINDDYYCTRLKNIVLSTTVDGGATWYDFAVLDKYKFACENNANYIYGGNETLLAVAPEEATLQFHSVPIKAQSLEYADSRLIDGGIVEGYDNIDVQYEIEPYVYDVLGTANTHYTFVQSVISNPNIVPLNYYLEFPVSIEAFRFGYFGKIGIVYYDDYDRKTGVLLSENPFLKTINYRDMLVGEEYGNAYDYLYPTDYLVNRVKLRIFNEPPSWATKYRIVRTKDLSQSSYLMWCVDKYETLDASGTVSPLNPKYFKIYVSNIGYYTEKAERGSIIEYTYERGDRVRFIYYNGPSTPRIIPNLLDFIILESGPDYFLIDYEPGVNEIQPGSIIEIYSKGKENIVTNPLFYETSECFEIKSTMINGVMKKYHTGNDKDVQNPDQSYLPNGVSKPAFVDIGSGGNYFRFRKMYWDTTTPSVKSRRMWISSDYADEFEESKFDGLFRPNAPLQLGKIDLPSAFRFSDQYRSGTEINGLSSYNPLNIEKYSTEYGLLKKLKLVDNDVIKAVFENSFQVSIYIKQGVIKQTQGSTSLVSITDNVLTNSHVIQRTLGTQNPESVVLNDEGDVFGYDENKGVVWRSSGNGLIQVSDYLQKTNFRDWSNKRNVYNKVKSQAPAVYDIYHDEYILTLGSIEPLPYIPPKAVINILGPGKGGMIVSVSIAQNGLIISNPTFIPDNIQFALQDHIVNSFLAAGFNAYLDVNGNVIVEAPGISYANYSIVINSTYNTVLLSENIVKNSDFSLPNLPENINWKSYFDAPNVAYDYLITYPAIGSVAPNSLFLSRFFDGGGTDPFDDYCVQYNVGFKTGKTYKVAIDYEGDIVNIGIGDPNNSLISSTGPLTSPIRQVQEFYLTYVENPAAFDILYIKMDVLAGKIYDIKAFELYEQNVLTRYEFDSGQKGDDDITNPFEPLTISFSKQKNGWTHYYSFIPEYYGKINDNIVSFKDGDIYVHTTAATPKNYYGVQYPRELTFVSNKDFPKVKVFKELMVNGLGVNSAPTLVVPPYEGVPTGMETELTTAHFSVKEGMQYAAIQKDKLTPGFSTTDLAWLNGRSMRGQYIIVTLSNAQPVQSLIYSTEILYFYSENS